MQQVPAFSRLQTVPAAPVSASRPKLWILDSWRDLILYVGTPLLLVPVFALAQARWSPQDIYLFVAAFGAMGHHLPGMIRAYGDRALFERFKWRFIFAPLFLLAVCTAFFWWDLKGILLVVFFWGVWHGLMQTYGFCRIYDAKTGTFDALTRRLDFAMCVIWFATAVALSPYRLSDTLDTYYMCGGPFIPPSMVQLGQGLILLLAVAVSGLFVAHFCRLWIIGKRPNPVKLALLITSIAFTGSDPYLRTGTDVGILYQATSGLTLKTLIQGKHAAAQQANPAVKAVQGDIAGVLHAVGHRAAFIARRHAVRTGRLRHSERITSGRVLSEELKIRGNDGVRAGQGHAGGRGARMRAGRAAAGGSSPLPAVGQRRPLANGTRRHPA